MFSSKNKKKTIGNAGFKSERVDGRNKMKGSVRKETNNLEEGSYGRKVLSKLATELEISCDGTFSCDKFDAKSCLKFQQFPQSNPLYKEVAKKADDWSKVVKFNMMVDNHGDKERAGAPSKAMRTFPLVFNGFIIDGIQTVTSPFTTIEQLHSHDLDTDNDGTFRKFIKEMAVEQAKKGKGSSDIDQKIKNAEKDMRKCVRDIKHYTQKDTMIEMWKKWECSSPANTPAWQLGQEYEAVSDPVLSSAAQGLVSLGGCLR